LLWTAPFSIGGRYRQKKSGDREGAIGPSRTALARHAQSLPDFWPISRRLPLQRQIRLEDLLQASDLAARLGLK
jgi:hypothetical protein